MELSWVNWSWEKVINWSPATEQRWLSRVFTHVASLDLDLRPNMLGAREQTLCYPAVRLFNFKLLKLFWINEILVHSLMFLAQTFMLLTLSKVVEQRNLLDSGIHESSWVWKRHLSTPTSVVRGNGLDGFFRPICDLALNSSLSMFGCVYDTAIKPSR